MAGGAVRMQVNPRHLRGLLTACDRADENLDAEVKATLKRAGEIVRSDAAGRMAPKHSKTAAGYKVRIRASRKGRRRVSVAQSKRKTTAKHPEWGAWQIRHSLLPAVRANVGRVEQEFDEAASRVSRRFEVG